MPAAKKFLPSQHPRDRFGRFTRSRSTIAEPGEKQQAVKVASGLKPKRGVTGANAAGYLLKIGPEQHRETVSGYTAGGYVDTHKALRAGKVDDPSVTAMDAAMVDLPDDLIVSRRVPLSAFGDAGPDSISGLKVRDAAYVPTSLGTVRATKSDVRMRLAVPKGTRAAVDPNTGEVILDRDLEMVVAKVEANSVGGHDMYVTVLPRAKGEGSSGTTSRPDTAAKKTAPAKTAPPAGQDTDTPEGADEVRAELMKLKVPELQVQMRERGLKPGKLRKSQLVDALVADEMGDDSTSGRDDDAATPDSAEKAVSPEPAADDPTTAAVADQIREAYQRLSPRPEQWVGLADLRDQLDGVDRETADAALFSLLSEPGVRLIPVANKKALSDRDRAAALRIGPEDSHTISMTADASTRNGAPATAKTTATPAKKATPEPAPAATRDGATSDEEQIFSAYRELASKPNEWIGLADLRDRLTGMDRADQDAALLALVRQPGVRIIPVANTKALDTRDREAAIRVGHENAHTIAIADDAQPPTPAKPAPAKKTQPAAKKADKPASNRFSAMYDAMMEDAPVRKNPVTSEPAGYTDRSVGRLANYRSTPIPQVSRTVPKRPPEKQNRFSAMYEAMTDGKDKPSTPTAAPAGKPTPAKAAPAPTKKATPDTAAKPAKATPPAKPSTPAKADTAKKATPVPAVAPVKPAAAPAGKIGGTKSAEPIKPNTWGLPNYKDGDVHAHFDGEIPRAVDAIGDEKYWDVDGQPLANVLGKIATDTVLGRATSQQQLEQLRALAARLPDDSRAKRVLANVIRDLDAPATPVPVVPEGTPVPLRKLAAALHAVPLVRNNPAPDFDPLMEAITAFHEGKLGGARLITTIRALFNKRHESREGKFEVDRAIKSALAELEELRKTFPAGLRPPT